jgi:hypothetical protein
MRVIDSGAAGGRVEDSNLAFRFALRLLGDKYGVGVYKYVRTH